MTDEQLPVQSNPDEVERLSRRLGALDPRQVAIWCQMSPARRLELAFQAHQFALETVRATEQLDVIEPATAGKVDLVPLPDDLLTRMAFQRRVRIVYDAEGHTACFIRPEDIVVAKLVAHQATESEKHLRDARGVFIVQEGDLDLHLVRRTEQAAGVGGLFDLVPHTAQRTVRGASGAGQAE